jgi:predicted metal-dependent HD superfamily phosphohydrolase
MNKYIEEISTHIKVLFESQLPSFFVYHNFQHTRDVVSASNEIAENSDISEEEKELLIIAAWFHDTGYIKSVENHEEKSAEIAEAYLKERNFPLDQINSIKGMILSTRIPHSPKNIAEEILCDADLVYLGNENLMVKIELLRTEWKSTINRTYSDSEWLKQNINFIEANFFHTEYARKKFGAVRKINLDRLKQKAAEIDKNKFL